MAGIPMISLCANTTGRIEPLNTKNPVVNRPKSTTVLFIKKKQRITTIERSETG